jgi:hypothetical protein
LELFLQCGMFCFGIVSAVWHVLFWNCFCSVACFVLELFLQCGMFCFSFYLFDFSIRFWNFSRFILSKSNEPVTLLASCCSMFSFCVVYYLRFVFVLSVLRITPSDYLFRFLRLFYFQLVVLLIYPDRVLYNIPPVLLWVMQGNDLFEFYIRGSDCITSYLYILKSCFM